MLRVALFIALAISAPVTAQAEKEALIGRLTDPDGKPLAGVVVQAWRAEGRGMAGLDLAYNRDFRLVAECRTNKRGRILLRVPRALPVQLRIDHPPYARHVRDATIGGEGLVVRLQHGATLTGQVVRAGDGMPIRSSVRAWQVLGPSTEVLRGRTDRKGRFRFDRLAPGKIRVDIEPEAATGPRWLDVDLEAGKTTDRRVEVAPGVLLRGRVLDAVTGRPIQDAEVGEGWTFSKAVRCDAHGRYQMRGFGSPGYLEAYCRAPGYVNQVVRHEKMEKTDPFVLDWRLVRGESVTGRVLDPAGQPLADIYVAAVGMTHDGQTHYHDWVAARTGEDGRFRMSGLEPKIDHVILARRDGWATLVYHLPRADGKGVRHAGELRMRHPRTLRGRVVQHVGKPPQRLKVGLWGVNADRERLAKEADMRRLHQGDGWSLLRRYVSMRRVYTDDEGRFSFGDLPAGVFGLVVYDERNQKLQSIKEIAVEPDVDPKDLVVEIDL